MSAPRIDIVVVNYNTRDRTIECLDSVARQHIGGVRIIVVDNGSHDGSVAAISAAHPDAVVIAAGENLGFARGVNRGVERSDAEYVLLLNPDATVFPGSLEALVEFAQSHPAYGVYGGRTVRPDGTLDPSSCWGAPTPWSLLSFATGLSTVFKRSRLFDPESLGRWQRDSVREVDIVTGCLLLIRRADWVRLGGMDERFFLYGEDAEFSMRARRRGLRPVIVPDAVIQHDVGGSTGSTGRKMAMVLAGKVTYLWSMWWPPFALLGVLLLQAGAATRAVLEVATRTERATWRQVWAHRRAWRRGYPSAERTLFGRTPPARDELTVQAEPAFRTEAANPYNAELYRALQRRGVRVRDLDHPRLVLERTHIVHLHWPDLSFLAGPRRYLHVARLSLFYGTLAVARSRGTRLVWTVHNVSAHETRSSPLLRGIAERLLLANVDGIIALSERGLEDARSAYPALADVPAAVTPHGHYRGVYGFGIGRDEARRRLGLPLSRPVIASIGQIRPYKDIPRLIDVFAAMETDATLLIAGQVSPASLRADIEERAAADDRVMPDLRFIPDEEMPVLFAAADLVVIPYTRIQNSGSAVLALSADRPVLVPDMGALAELRATVGDDWVRLYTETLGPDALADALVWATARDRPQRADLRALDWDTIAESTVRAYQDFRARTRRRNSAPIG